MPRGRLLASLVVLGLLASVLTGCGSKVSESNYEKIKTDMTRAEVEAILGEGTETSGGGASIGGISASGTVVTWKDGEKSITVTFANDKVVMKTKKGM